MGPRLRGDDSWGEHQAEDPASRTRSDLEGGALRAQVQARVAQPVQQVGPVAREHDQAAAVAERL